MRVNSYENQNELEDRSGAILTGGVSQKMCDARPGRMLVLIQNPSSGDLWFNFGLAATVGQPSIRLAPGDVAIGSLVADGVLDPRQVNVIGATAGQTFTCKEY